MRNAIYEAVTITAMLEEHEQEVIPNPAYSLDQYPSEFDPFANLKHSFGGIRYTNSRQTIYDRERTGGCTQFRLPSNGLSNGASAMKFYNSIREMLF